MGHPLPFRHADAVTGWAAPPPSLATTDAPLRGDVARHAEAGMRAPNEFLGRARLATLALRSAKLEPQ